MLLCVLCFLLFGFLILFLVVILYKCSSFVYVCCCDDVDSSLFFSSFLNVLFLLFFVFLCFFSQDRSNGSTGAMSTINETSNKEVSSSSGSGLQNISTNDQVDPSMGVSPISKRVATGDGSNDNYQKRTPKELVRSKSFFFFFFF